MQKHFASMYVCRRCCSWSRGTIASPARQKIAGRQEVGAAWPNDHHVPFCDVLAGALIGGALGAWKLMRHSALVTVQPTLVTTANGSHPLISFVTQLK